MPPHDTPPNRLPRAGPFSWSPIGSWRMRLPVAAKIAFHSAGANGGTPTSPIPPGGASLSTMETWVSAGATFMRRDRCHWRALWAGAAVEGRAARSPLPVRFTVLEEKVVGRTVHEGQLAALSAIAAGMESVMTPGVLSNLQITVAITPLGNPPGEIYGKAVESVEGTPGRVKIRFSSVTPALKTWIRAFRM
jgi:hypothetical protein